MVRALACGVVGEMFLHYPRAERHCTKYRGVPRCVVGEAEYNFRIHCAISLQHVQVNVIEVLRAGGVIGVALHQHQILVDGQDCIDRATHVFHSRGARRQEHRLTFGGDALDDLQPCDVAGSDLDGRKILLELIHGLEVINR